MGCIHAEKRKRGVTEEPKGAPGAKVPAPSLLGILARYPLFFIFVWIKRKFVLQVDRSSG